MTHTRYLILFFFSACLVLSVKAQMYDTLKFAPSSTIGGGVGLPYGTIGAHFGQELTPRFGLFAGAGYDLADIAFTLGFEFDFIENDDVAWYGFGMYGSNASVFVSGSQIYTKSFRGPSIGSGLKIKLKKNRGNYIDIGLTLPFRSEDYDDHLEDMRNNSNVDDISEPWSVLLSLGINFCVICGRQ